MSDAPAVFLCQVCDQTPASGHAPDCPGWLTMTDEARTLAERCELLDRQREVAAVAHEWACRELDRLRLDIAAALKVLKEDDITPIGACLRAVAILERSATDE